MVLPTLLCNLVLDPSMADGKRFFPFGKITEVPSRLQNALGILRQLHLLQAQELLNPSPALQILIHMLLLTNLASVSSAGVLLAPEAKMTPNNLAE